MQPTQRTRIAAYAVIVDDERILLCRISAALPNLAGRWTLPGGGLDFGEEPAAGMIREVQEETGLVVEPGEVAHVDSFVRNHDDRVTHHVRIIYRARFTGGELRHEVAGTTDRCEWWSKTALPNCANLAEIGCRLAFG